MKSKIFNVSMDCVPEKVYDFVSNPENLPQWAKTFCRSIQKRGGEWVIQTAQGPMKIRFAAKNDWGVLDHFVSPAPGVEVFVPMRVVPNGEGSELVFTLFQQPGMTDEGFEKDAGMVRQDLGTLKDVLERVKERI